jgi:hypothetical protein
LEPCARGAIEGRNAIQVSAVFVTQNKKHSNIFEKINTGNISEKDQKESAFILTIIDKIKYKFE